MRRRPPRSTRTDTLFPYTTLVRSAITQVEIALGRLLLVDALVAPPPDLARERLDQILGQAKRFTDIADGALRAIADDRRAERSMVATIGVEHPLHDALAPRMLEIDVDEIGRAHV